MCFSMVQNQPQYQDEYNASRVFDESLAHWAKNNAGIILKNVSKSYNNRGIFAKEHFQKGHVILEIPIEECIVVDYVRGVLLPSSGTSSSLSGATFSDTTNSSNFGTGSRIINSDEWPRTKAALHKNAELPWDIIQALAILDAMSGRAPETWQKYTNYILPQPLDVTLPVCMPEHILVELQDETVQNKSQMQQMRLQEMFPGLSVPMVEDGPSWLQYAFACVRSRAFKIRDDAYAFVPILDIANHAIEPNADFALSDDGTCLYFFAMKDIQANEEVCISYSGRVGYTNERMMLQYGFVFEYGNPFDRYTDIENQIGSELATVSLGLEKIQQCFGDEDRMVDTFSGKDAYSYAALKSLPIRVEDDEAAHTRDVEVAYLRKLLSAVDARIASWKTLLREDESVLAHMKISHASDERVKAALNYRIQKKRFDIAMQALLQLLLDSW